MAAGTCLAVVVLASAGAPAQGATTRSPSPAPRRPARAGLPAAEGGLPFQETSQLHGGTGLFGASVAVSADGRTAIVGAPLEGGGAGSARIFALTPSGWQEQAKLAPSETVEETGVPCEGEGEECRLGISVAISGDGDTALVGSPLEEGRTGAVRTFVRTGSTWSQLGPKIKGESSGKALFGRSVAISTDGQEALIGAPGSATASFLRRSSDGWTQEGPTIEGPRKASTGRFGRTVALSGDGTVAFIGGPGLEGDAGAVWAYVHEEGAWQQQGPILTGGGEETAGGHFGSGLALSEDGSTALVGANGDDEGIGAAWALTRSGTTWVQQGPKLTAPEEVGPAHFGSSVALSGSGENALIGGPADFSSAGAVWTFSQTDSLWSASAKIAAPQAPEATRFGTSVSLSADGLTAVIGAPFDLGLPGSAWALRTPPPPTVASITPAEGPSGGGTTVTITGTGFLPGASVQIGTETASVSVESETTITAVTAATTAGSYEVQVSDAGGTSTSGPSYIYRAPPSVAHVAPAEGPSAGGTKVKITGTGFLPGASVQIGTAAVSVAVESETTITAVTAATKAGRDEVRVSDTRGSSTGGPSFTYKEPATTSTSETPPPEGGVLSNQVSVPPQPILAVRGNLEPVAGLVKLRLPGSHRFVEVTGLTEVPFGSIVDATNGTVSITTADGHGGTQSIKFYQGEFALTQSSNGQTIAKLMGGNEDICKTARRGHGASVDAQAATARKVVRKLWANGHGKYSTEGHYAAGAVLGTQWLTEDLCDGTLIRVLTDKVLVTDFVKHRHIIVKAGHSYLALAR